MNNKESISKAVREFAVSSAQVEEGRRQVINLKHLIESMGDISEDTEKKINDLLKQLRSGDGGQLVKDADQLAGLSEQASALCLESLAETLENILTMIDAPAVFSWLGSETVVSQLILRSDEVADAVSCLRQSGFFQKHGSAAPKSTLEGRKILVVEDMLHNRLLLKKILKKQNTETVEAVNGQEAIDRWREVDDLDMIIMDMNMPVMDGFTATRTIRALEVEEGLNRIPIIALTALAMRGDREKCLEAGCDDYLPKPVEANALVSISNSLLSGAETESQETIEQLVKLEMKPVIVKTDNQVIHQLLETLLEKLAIQPVLESDPTVIETKLYNNESDLVFLEAPADMELAFHLNNKFSDKYVIPVVTNPEKKSALSRDRANILAYPFDLEQLKKVLLNYVNKISQARKQEEQIADATSLGKIKGQASIAEAVQKSNKQLAVWQKAFRKIGGDLVLSYQFNLHGKFGFILGDVAGHDIQSGYSASWFSGLVKGVWEQNRDPFDLLRYLNTLFAHDADEADKRFVCALVLLWDPLRNKLSYANAGIPGGILVKKNSTEAIDLQWKGIPIGMFPDVDMFDHDSIAFYPGDRLYIATDGVLEAIPSDVISGLGETKANQPPQEALDGIVDFVTRSIEVTDDLTIAVFEARELPEPQNGFRQIIKSSFQEVDGFLERLEQYVQKRTVNQFDWPMVSIAIREALINAVEHGNNSKTELPVDIDVELDESSLSLKISDCGSGFDLSTEKERLEKEGELRIHGRGIEMMENITAEMAYTGSGVYLKFDKTNNL